MKMWQRMRFGIMENGSVSLFSDSFIRSNGSLGNNWIGSSWSINNNQAINTLGGTEIFDNPGCEGTYTAGLAPNWASDGSPDSTKLEEDTIVHGGAKAQKVIGGTTTAAGVAPTPRAVVTGSWYIFNGWLRNEGPGNVTANNKNSRFSTAINTTVAPTGGAYSQIVRMDKAVSTGVESMTARQVGTTPTTWYCDDWSLKLFTYSKLFTTQFYPAKNVTCGVAITGNVGDRAGVVIKVDDPNNPQNYVVAFVANGVCQLRQVLAGVETAKLAVSVTYVDGAVLQVVQNKTTYQLFYNGAQLGTEVTINNSAINNNQYVGLYSNGISSFNSFSAQDNGIDSTANYVVFDGDSLTQGSGSSGGMTYPYQTFQLLGEGWQYSNQGNGGDTTTLMITGGTAVDSLYSSSHKKNIVVVACGINDLRTNGLATDAHRITAYNNLVTYCTSRKVTGYKVIISTITPTTFTGVDVNYEAQRQLLNASILANWATFADGVVDVGGDAILGNPATCSDGIYFFSDQLHMKNAGYAVWATLAAPVILAM